MYRRMFPLLLFMALPVAAEDGVIYKCVDASRRVTFQNSPCPAGHETKSARSYTDPGYNPDLARKVERDRIVGSLIREALCWRIYEECNDPVKTCSGVT
jgi:hypothetical protein